MDDPHEPVGTEGLTEHEGVDKHARSRCESGINGIRKTTYSTPVQQGEAEVDKK